MQEYTTRAVALRKEPLREQDLRVTLFTEQFGKVTAKATSARKITSKLSAHLEPGTMLTVRLAEKGGASNGGLQITDALKLATLPLTPYDLYALDHLIPSEEPDPALWDMFAQPRWNWPDVLAVLGWDPHDALCEICKTRAPEYFALATQSLYCPTCIATSRLPKDALLYIGNDDEHLGTG